MATRPDMTAHWESVLTQISEKQCRYQDFMQPLVGTLYQADRSAKCTPVRQFAALWLRAVVAVLIRKRRHRVNVVRKKVRQQMKSEAGR
ncbi:hypothetical protein ACNKHT_09255 [Shigella flexneri]